MTHVDGWDPEEHERQYRAALALRQRLEAEAAAQREGRILLEHAANVSEQATQLAALNDRLNSGTPIENLPTRDIQFLVGSEEKKRLWNTYGSTRRQRWAKAVQSMPQPPAEASEHVVTTYVRLLEKVHGRKNETVLSLPKQAGDWYRELARREVVSTLAKHVPACTRRCTAAEWSFVLDQPSFMPFGVAFDRAGNYRPPSDGPDPDRLQHSEGAESRDI